MEKLLSYEQYSQVLAAFKMGRERCNTNKLMTREELSALIEADKLLYEQIGDTFWFFTKESNFYTGVYYVPADKTIEMRSQDMDVVVDLMGKGDRYDERRDEELVAAGFEKRDKRLEMCCNIPERIDSIKEQEERVRAVWSAQGFTCRRAVKADYPAMLQLLEERIGRERYTIIAMTDTELETMERDGGGVVACDPEGKICAVGVQFIRGNVGYAYLGASNLLGLGAWTNMERFLIEYQAGCVKEVGWIREDNAKSLGLSRHFRHMTGKFYWQFVFRVQHG